MFFVPTLSPPFHASQKGLQTNPDNPDHAASKLVMDRHQKIILAAYQAGVRQLHLQKLV